MSDRKNSQPATTVAADSAQVPAPTPTVTPDVNRTAQAIARGQRLAGEWGHRGIGLVKRRPVFAAAALAAAVALGAYGMSGSRSVPVAQAGLGAAPASKVHATGQRKTVEMVVGSYRKTDTLLILNNTPSYKDATMNVVVDLKQCPELAAVNPRALKGLKVEATGEYQEYAGKPQIKVTRAEDLKVDPKGVTPADKKS